MDLTDKLADFKWPEQVISDATVAKEYVDSIQETHRRAWDLIKLMEDHIDGQRPKDPLKLKEEGKAWANNWNYGKARSKIEITVAENVDTILNAMAMMSIVFKEPTDEQLKDEDYAWMLNPELKDTFSNILELNLNALFDEQQRCLSWLTTTEYNSTTWGWCPVVKDRRTDWLGQPQHIRSIGFPKKTKAENINSFMVSDTIEADVMWRRWHEVKRANLQTKVDTCGQTYRQAPNGYILEGLEEVIYHCYNGKFKSNGHSENIMHRFEEIVPDFIENCNLAVANTSSVRVATIYHIEMDGKRYTKTIVAYGNGWKSEKTDQGQVRYGAKHSRYHQMTDYSPCYLLYQQTEPVDSIEDIISLILDSGFTTNNTIQEMRGLGRYAVEDSLRFNRKKNSIEDKLLFAGSPVLRKAMAGTGDDGPKLYPSQGFTLIGSGYDFEVKQPSFDLGPHLVSLNTDESHYNRETEHYRPSLSGKLSSRPVTSEVQAKTAEVQRIEGSKLNIKLKSYSSTFLGVIKGLAYHLNNSIDSKLLTGAARKGLESFKEKTLADLKGYNITTEAQLKKILEAVDYVVMESITIDAQAIIEQLQQATTPYRRLRLNRMLALARGFSRKEINLMYPLKPVPDSISQAKFAAMENLMMKDTVEVVFSPDDDHLGHLDFHYPKCFSLIEQIQQTSDDPVPLYNWLGRLVEHSGMHVDHLLRLPYLSEEVKTKYLNILKQLMAAQAEMRKMIEDYANQVAQQQQQQATTQEIDPKVQAQIQMDWAKLESRERIAALRSDFRAEEMRKNNELKRQVKLEDHQSKQQRQAEMAQLKKDIEVMKSSLNLGQL